MIFSHVNTVDNDRGVSAFPQLVVIADVSANRMMKLDHIMWSWNRSDEVKFFPAEILEDLSSN